MTRRVHRAALAAAALLLSSPLPAQQIDTTYSRLIREATTDPHFLPATVATVPSSATVPSPRAHFGTIAGAPGVMHYSAELYGYFRALSRATSRVRVEKIGTTEEGRDIVLVIVASEEGMKELDAQKALAARLSDPRTLSAADAEGVIAQAMPIYYLNGGLHSTEMGSPEMLTELAYRLAVSDEPAIRRIRDRVITIINPVSEPDGRDKQVDWYLHYTKGRPTYEDGFPRSTPYWGKYVFHDNNRDGIQISQALTHAIFDTYFAWHPLVMHDLHESVPLLYVSTGTGPYNETADPIQVGEWQLLANNDVTALSALGLPGVWTWGFFDGWWPGYAMWVANNHNGVGRFYETFGNAGGDTYVRDLSRGRYAGEAATARTWYRAWPPTKKVRWSSRDNVNYMQAGVLASLTYTAENSGTLLRNFYRKGANSLERGRTQAPYGYVIPAAERQRDPKRAAYLINQLERQHVEIHRVASGDSAGDFVIKLDQPYRDLVVNLLSKQNFPSTAQYPPYDDIAWTLGYLYGVDVVPVNNPSIQRRANLVRVMDTVAVTMRPRGAGAVFVIANKAQGDLLPALYWLRGARATSRAFAAESAFVIGSDSFPTGSVIIEGATDADATMLGSRFGLTAVGATSPPGVSRHALDLPRVAIYRNWDDTQDEGWARYTFEQYGLPYTSIDKDDLKRGRLRDRFDVILLPNMGGSVPDLIHGSDSKWGPLPYQKTKETPNLGVPASSPDVTSGPGFEGMAELQRFANDGGTIVTLAGATRMVGETGIAPALSPITTRTLFHPGSVVQARARRPRSPILYGYPATTHVFKGNGPLYEVSERDSNFVVLGYGTRRETPKDTGAMLGMPETVRSMGGPTSQDVAGKLTPSDSSAARRSSATTAGGGASGGSEYVLSGMVRGQEEIVGQGAIFDIPVKRGRVIAFTFDPLHRFLNHHEFPLVWNALMNWNDLIPVAADGSRTRVAGEQ